MYHIRIKIKGQKIINIDTDLESRHAHHLFCFIYELCDHISNSIFDNTQLHNFMTLSDLKFDMTIQ